MIPLAERLAPAGLLLTTVALAAAGAGLVLGLALGKRAGARGVGAARLGDAGGEGKQGYLLGVDIGGTGVKVGVVALDGRVLSSLSQDIADATLDGVVALIGQLADRALGEAGLQARDLSGVGVCVPGMVDVEAGCVNFAAHFAKWPRPAPLASCVSRRLGGLPVALENDGKVALMAEVWLGAARGSRHAVMLTLGTGVGGAIVSDGRLIKGDTGLAGEVGHTLVVRGGRFASGTNTRGALEEYVSARAVGRIAQEALAAAPSSQATTLRGVGEPLTAKHVFDHARQGDALARSLVDDTCDMLAISAINMVRIFDTKHVIFGGGLVAAGDILIDGIRARFKHHYWSLTSPDSVEVSIAHLGTRAGMIGAAYLAHPDYRGAGAP